MDTEEYTCSTSAINESEHDKMVFRQLEMLISKVNIVDADTLAFVSLLLEEQTNQHPSGSFLFWLRLKKIKYDCGLLQQYKDNTARLDLILRTARQIHAFVIDTIREYGDNLRMFDLLYRKADNPEPVLMTEQLGILFYGTEPKWAIKLPIEKLLNDRIQGSDITDYRIGLLSITEAYERVRVLPTLDMSGCIRTQRLVSDIQGLYLDLNNAWTTRYNSVFQLTEQPEKWFSTMYKLKGADAITFDRVMHRFDRLLCFNPYGTVVNLKEILICLCRELESWVTISHRRY